MLWRAVKPYAARTRIETSDFLQPMPLPDAERLNPDVFRAKRARQIAHCACSSGNSPIDGCEELAASRLHPAIARIRPISHGNSVPSCHASHRFGRQHRRVAREKTEPFRPAQIPPEERAPRCTTAVPGLAATAVCRSCSTRDARRLSQARGRSRTPVAAAGTTDPRPRSRRRSARGSRRRPGHVAAIEARHRPMHRTLHMELSRQSPAGRPCPRLRAKPPRSYSSPAVSMSGGRPRARRAGSF